MNKRKKAIKVVIAILIAAVVFGYGGIQRCVRGYMWEMIFSMKKAAQGMNKMHLII